MIRLGARSRGISCSKSSMQQVMAFATTSSTYNRNAIKCKRNSLVSLSTFPLSSTTALTSSSSFISATNSTTFNARFAHDHDYSDQYPPPKKVPMTFLDWSGMRHDIEAVEGQTLLEAAREWDVPLIGICNGGGLSPLEYGHGCECGSCLLFVPKGYNDAFQPPTIEERIALETQRVPMNEQSRLGCEIVVNESMAGCTFLIPEPSEPFMESIIPDLGESRRTPEVVFKKASYFEESHVVAKQVSWVAEEAKDQAKRFLDYQNKAMKKSTSWSGDPKAPVFLPSRKN